MKNLILLQPFSLEKSAEFFKLTDQNRIYLKQWLPWLDFVQTEPDTAHFLAKNIASDQQGKTLNFFIVMDKKIIGTIGLRDITSQSALVGYWLAENVSGKGITTCALQQLIDLAMKNNITDAIILRCHPDNHASAKIAQKCGFHYIDTLLQAENLYGKLSDLQVYEKVLHL